MTLAQSSLPECEGNDINNPLKKFLKTKKWTNCHGTFLDLKGKPGYVGEFYKGQPHGQGTFTHAGRKYVGQWKKGKYNKPDNQRGRDGTGTYTYANGDKYFGEWKKGLRHGKGTFTHFNGKVEEGIWKKDKLVKLKQ